jgi:hypothetical protein
MLGAPFKPHFGLSGIMALDLPLPDCHCRKEGEKSAEAKPGLGPLAGLRSRSPSMGSFSWAGVANGKWQIESHYPTQAKGRLEWGTQHLLLVLVMMFSSSSG